MARIVRALLVVILTFTIASILSASLPIVQTGQWVDSSSLTQARSGAAAVLLPDGRVMITGGDVNGSPSSSVEMFNADGSISSVAPMSTPRSGHSAFLLTTGEVLVTGGRTSGGGATNSTELYDPTEDAWTAAPAMQDARAGHTVLQLPDWTVLVIGGTNSSGPVSAVERYSPASNSFSHAGVLNHARLDAAAAVLDDGRVLVAGGIINDGGQSAASASSEIFDPVTGTSSDAGALSVARAGASATTLFDGRIAVIGGNDGSNDLASAEIYDPASAAWSVVAGGAPRSHHVAIALPYNNSVLLTGGSAGAATDLFIPWANNNQGAFVSTAASAVSHNGGIGSPLSTEGLLLAGAGDAGAATELFRFATVRTDQDDYVPGQTVTITGTGWKPGALVTITLVESPNIDTHPTITATADANGNIADSSFTTDAHDFQIRFFVYAHSAASDAATSFTDGGGAVAVAGVSSTTATTFSYTGFTDSTCTTVAGGQGQTFPKSITVTGNTTANLGLGNASFFKVTIPTDPAGFKFVNWSNAASGTNRTTACLAAGAGNTTTTAQANFQVANVATTLILTVSPGSVSFGSAGPVSLQATLKDASNNPVADASITFAVNGVNLSPAATTNANGVATFNYNPSALAASTTAYPVSASFSAAVIGGTSYLASSATGSLTVTKATPVITWPNPADITYGTALSATQLNATASSNGNPVAGTFTYTPAAGTVLNAGNNQALKADFVPTDTTDFNSVLGTTALINVLKATPVITVTDPAPTFDGTAKVATASATGIGGAVVSGTFAFTYKDASNTPIASPTNAGSYSVTASFTSSDTNYSNATGTGTLTIKQATPTVTVSGGPFTFDGNSHAATITVTGVGGATVSGSSAVTYNGVATVPTNAGTYAVAVTFTSSDNNYGNATGSGSIVINKADSTTVVTVAGGVTFTYDAAAHPATVAVTGAGGLSLTPDPVYSCGHAPINVADSGCTASYSYAGDANHNPSSDSKTYTINKATPTVSVSGGPFTFDGGTHAATVTVTGVGGATVSGSSAVTYNGVATVPTNAGTYAVAVTFTSSDNNYGNATGSGSIVINKADSTTVVTVPGGPTFTYDAMTHPATVSVTGAGGLSLTPDPVYSCGHAPINVADSGCTASYSYAGDANHNPSSDSKTYTINKATPTVSVSGGPFTFDGNAHAATITVTGVGGAAVSGSSAVTYNGVATVPINAGTYAVSATFTSADNNYYNATGSGSILINKANSTTAVSVAGGVTFTYDGNAHPATVSVTGAGGLNLTPDSVYSCGHAPINVADSGCTASYSFAGDLNHNPSSDSKTYTINKATPLVAVSGGPFTFDGGAHAATVTVAGVGGVTVSGSSAVTYNGVATVPINAGTYAVAVTFTSADNNYDNASGSGSILINKASSTTTVSGTFTFTYDGNSHPATVTVTGAGGLSLTPDPVYSCGHAPINVADSGCTASFSFPGDDNHNPSSDSKTYTINKATPVVTVSGGPFTFDGSAHAATITVSGVGGVTVSGSSAVTYNGLATVPSNAGTYAVSVTFTSADNNYDNAAGSGSILINKASSTTTVSGNFTLTYDGNPHSATVSVTGAGGLNLTPDPGYSCGHAPINVADTGCTASYSFAGDDNHNPSSDSKTYTISRATPVVTVSGGPFTFDGNSHVATITVTGIGGAAVVGSTVVTYNGSAALPLHAGTYAIAVTFTSADNNYDHATGSGSFLINQAPSITTVSGVFSFTYDGNAHPATVTVTGAGGLNLTPPPTYSCGHVPLVVADSGCIASYTYAGDTDHTGSSDAKTYSISKATPVLSINPLAPVTIGNPTTISGSVKLNLLVPTGAVTVTVNGISQAGAIGAGGAYSTTFAPGTINVGSYSVSAAYPGDANFNAVNNSGSFTLVVQYGICYLYDQTKSVQHNATVPIKLQLCDAVGHNLSSSTTTVTATSVGLVSGGSGTLEDSGSANPDDNFRYDPTLPGYIFNLSTKPLGTGTWRLSFRSSNDPAGTSPYAANFGVK